MQIFKPPTAVCPVTDVKHVNRILMKFTSLREKQIWTFRRVSDRNEFKTNKRKPEIGCCAIDLLVDNPRYQSENFFEM